MDDVMLEPLGKEVLKFQSPQAYKFFINAKDTHKSWQTLQILLIGTTLEMIKQFKSESDNPTPLEFLSWISNDCNPSIKLVGELILNYCLAIFVFKNGVRLNDVKLIDAGRLKFDDLFYYLP